MLLVSKLDYLQLLVVEWLRDAASAVGRAIMHALRSKPAAAAKQETPLSDLSSDDEEDGCVPAAVCAVHSWPLSVWPCRLGQPHSFLWGLISLVSH
jgi:hypothetical protein